LTKNNITDESGLITGFQYLGPTQYYGRSINGVTVLTSIDFQYYDTKEAFDSRYSKVVTAFNAPGSTTDSFLIGRG